MKNVFRISAAILLILSIFLIHSCKKEEIPTLTTSAITNITGTSAKSGGTITDEGSGTIIARGVCWSTGNTPTIVDNKTTDGTGAGSFVSNLNGVIANTTYYVRAYATNSAGTSYGNEISFISSVVSPVLTTQAITSIKSASASSGGNITSAGGSTITARGVCWNTTTGPTIALSNKTTDGTGTGIFASSITGLTAGTTYYVKAYAKNSIGTNYGNEVSFTTTASTVPVLTTTAASSITSTTTTSGGNISSDGGASVTARGVCWSISSNPTIALSSKTTNGTGTGSFTSNLSGLLPGITYYVRAYATNSAGTAYGSQVSFTTIINGGHATVTDIDGNVYKTITIGTQTWMAENLKTIKYNDGTAIPNVTDNTAWYYLTTPAYCWYNNDAATYKATYGALYNWYTVGTSKLCPTGWRVPISAEWTTLTTYLGSESVAGSKLKETGTAHWNGFNTDATNETGFTALPGGLRYNDGRFLGIGIGGYWWSSTETSDKYPWGRVMHLDFPYVQSFNTVKQLGYSVRCLRDY